MNRNTSRSITNLNNKSKTSLEVSSLSGIETIEELVYSFFNLAHLSKSSEPGFVRKTGVLIALLCCIFWNLTEPCLADS
ncbi:MAG: hypothetical protein HQM08_05895 [Candidatus Riflebacteria bacterium]|nr:hypothetical protein [Candidatus Riflebacteria bacterium]